MKPKAWRDDQEKRQKWMTFMQGFHPGIDPQTIRLMDEMGFVSRSIYHLSDQSLDDAGLSFAQYRVLMHLAFAEEMGGRNELNPSEISERQGVSRNTMSAFIRNLEDQGLVERRLDPQDRRRFNISLTDQGRELIRQNTRHHLETIEHCFHTLNSEELQTLIVLLQKLSVGVQALRQQTMA